MCTDFCQRLESLPLFQDRLPSYDNLISHLRYEADVLRSGVLLGTLGDLETRTYCPFCRSVKRAILSALNKASLDTEYLSTPVHALLYTNEQFFRLSYPSPLGTRICFVAKDETQISGPGLGRIVSDDRISPARILQWLATCDKAHGTACLKIDPNQEFPYSHNRAEIYANSQIRVIDLIHDCIRQVSLDSRFVTLSYVWGRLPLYRLTKKNIDFLASEGSLSKVWQSLPQTITDAIDLAKSLGETQLWIDVLCLIQDDETDVGQGVKMMNSIFERSYFTIIAASADNANGGLPGLKHVPRQVTRRLERLNSDLDLMVIHSIDKHLTRSPYNFRGWTLQELVLPRRSVIFVGGQVHFRCQHSNWSEDTTSDVSTHWLDPDDSNLMRIPAYEDGPLAAYWTLMKLLEDYSRRRLTFGGDALRAFYGVSRPLAASLESPLIEGMPWSYIDMSLLFASRYGDLQRRKQFASWSWAGWTGSLVWPRENYYWYETGSVVWDVSSLAKWNKAKAFIAYEAWHPNGELESINQRYSFQVVEGLDELVLRFGHLMPEEDIRKILHTNEVVRTSSSGSGGRGYGRPIEKNGVSSAVCSMGRLDLCNSQAELALLTENVKDVMERLLLQNWLAFNRFRLQREVTCVSEDENPQGTWETTSDSAHSLYRKASSCSEDQQLATNDDRRRLNMQRAWRDGKLPSFASDQEVPHFPAYSILHFQTISIRLSFGGDRFGDYAVTDKPQHRVPGTVLLDRNKQRCGELFLDDANEWNAHQEVECVILSWCLNVETMSATIDKDQGDLLWVLFIVWENGMAERRGVGKIQQSAVDNSIVPAAVKSILLA